MPGVWTEEMRQAARERLLARKAKEYFVKTERIRRDAERAARLKTTDEEKADDIIRMMFGNEGTKEPILTGRKD